MSILPFRPFPSLIAGPGALVSDLVAPGEGLAVEGLQGDEGASGEEALTDIGNGALDATFFVAPRRAARTGGEVVVSGEFEPAGMKVKSVAVAFEHDTTEIIGGQAARSSTPVVEGVDMTKEEVLQGLIEEEFQPQGTAVREGQDEGGEAAAGATDGDFAEAGPVGLGLLAGESLQAQKSFASRWADLGDHPAQLSHTTCVAASPNHLEEAGGILLQGLAEEVEVRIGEAIAETGTTAEAFRLQGGSHGGGMEASSAAMVPIFQCSA